MKSLIKREKGFTLIEIVIVLAIAAALILVVFLAVSGAQKSKRDTTTKTAAGQVAAQMENYASNNGGTAPTAAMAASYIGNIKDGTGAAPSYVAPTAGGITATLGAMKYAGSAVCNAGKTAYVTSTSTSAYAVVYYTESGGVSVCIDNQ